MVNVYVKERINGYEVIENDNGYITVLATFKSLRKAMNYAEKQYKV